MPQGCAGWDQVSPQFVHCISVSNNRRKTRSVSYKHWSQNEKFYKEITSRKEHRH